MWQGVPQAKQVGSGGKEPPNCVCGQGKERRDASPPAFSHHRSSGGLFDRRLPQPTQSPSSDLSSTQSPCPRLQTTILSWGRHSSLRPSPSSLCSPPFIQPQRAAFSYGFTSLPPHSRSPFLDSLMVFSASPPPRLLGLVSSAASFRAPLDWLRFPRQTASSRPAARMTSPAGLAPRLLSLGGAPAAFKRRWRRGLGLSPRGGAAGRSSTGGENAHVRRAARGIERWLLAMTTEWSLHGQAETVFLNASCYRAGGEQHYNL